MPELPEVQTTVDGLNKTIRKKKIVAVWTDWKKMFRNESFSRVQKIILGATVQKAERRAKNILIGLSNGYTLLIHMKMTGHLMYGKYVLKDKKWVPQDPASSLADPFNRFIHVLFTLSDGKHLAFCDSRKFGKVWIEKTDSLLHSPHLAHLGPEPLDETFTFKEFKERLLRRPKAKIKPVLIDQTVIAGIGNIYSDEMLWISGIHPESVIKNIPEQKLKLLFPALKKVLRFGIDFGGDSTSDYRNIEGKRGEFHHEHNAYQKTGSRCKKKGCSGVILRKMVGGRSAHFCDTCQIKY